MQAHVLLAHAHLPYVVLPLKAYTEEAHASVNISSVLLITIGSQPVRELQSLFVPHSCVFEVKIEGLRVTRLRLLTQNVIPLPEQRSKFAIEQAPQVQHVLLLTVCVVTGCLHRRNLFNSTANSNTCLLNARLGVMHGTVLIRKVQGHHYQIVFSWLCCQILLCM